MEVLAGARRHLEAATRTARGGPNLRTTTRRTLFPTVRRLIDCLIAAVAIGAGVPVLHRDDDFDVARHTELDIVRPDRRSGAFPGPTEGGISEVGVGRQDDGAPGSESNLVH